jgi:hypothetical protein
MSEDANTNFIDFNNPAIAEQVMPTEAKILRELQGIRAILERVEPLLTKPQVMVVPQSFDVDHEAVRAALTGAPGAIVPVKKRGK